MQHATVFDVLDLDRGIDAALQANFVHSSVCHCDGAWHLLQRLNCVETRDRHGFIAGQTQRFAAHTICELKRDNAHANKVGTVDTLKALRDDRFDT